MHLSKELFLGRPAFDPQPYTRLDPVAIARVGAWRTRTDWSSVLPPEGRAFARQLPGFTSRSLVAFGIEPNTKADTGKDQFSVANPEPVYEVLDYQQSDVEIARRQLVEVGQPRLFPGSDTVVAALRGGLCIKVKVSRHPTTGFWVADLDGLENLPVHTFDRRLFDGEQVDGHWITLPGLTVGAATGTVNWCRDADFPDLVLRRLRKAGAHASAGGPTRPQLAQLVGQLDRADLLPGDGADLAAMRDRLRTFVPSLNHNVSVLDEIVLTLSALTPVKERLIAAFAEQNQAFERERRLALEDSIIREMEAKFFEVKQTRELREDKLLRELQELQQERDGLAQEVAALAMDLVTKRKELNEVRLSSEKARSALATDLNQLLGELSDVALPLDADIMQLGARLAAKLGEPGAAFEVAVQAGPPWTKARQMIEPAKSWDEFDKEMATIARQSGFFVDDLRVADVVVRGGGLVVLPEESASRFIGCYADIVAGGGYGRHVLDPSVISLDDLWRLPGSGRHGCLSRAWAAAQLDPTRFQILWLDGLHRTPSVLWVSSLLDILRDPRKPRNLLVFASLGTPSIDPNRAWHGPIEPAVAIAPVMVDGLPPASIGRAIGVTRRMAHFDAVHTPVPTPADVMRFVTSMESGMPVRMMEFACEVHRAAWPFGAEHAAELARAVARPGEPKRGGLAAGASWLHGRMQNNE